MEPNKNDILKIEFVENSPISDLTTYKTQGFVKGVFYPKTVKELIITYNFLTENRLPFKIIGNGSNLLISPNCNLLFLSTKKLKQFYKTTDESISFSASTPLAKAYNICLKNELKGFETLAGIPATIGGAIKNNASAFGVSISDNLESIKVFKQGKIQTLKKKDIDFSHHQSNLKNLIILSAKFNLEKDSVCKITQDFVYFQSLRNEKQPKGFSCGSVFKNPPLLSAGYLIESCGLKGATYGDACISNKHANFILNNGNATFEDVVFLINLCKTAVQENFEIELQTEVEIVY